MVSGATGAVGSAAVQIGCHLGATVSTKASLANHALARSLGAGTLCDYRDGTPPGLFDVILEFMGTLGWARARSLLAPGGRLVMVTADLSHMLGAAQHPRRRGCRVLTGTNKDDLPGQPLQVLLRKLGELRQGDRARKAALKD